MRKEYTERIGQNSANGQREPAGGTQSTSRLTPAFARRHGTNFSVRDGRPVPASRRTQRPASLPRSSPSRSRTATAFASISLSPITRMYGTFCFCRVADLRVHPPVAQVHLDAVVLLQQLRRRPSARTRSAGRRWARSRPAPARATPGTRRRTARSGTTVIRSIVLMTPRWIITGRFGVSSESLYSSLNCSGRCWSTWMVESVSSRPITSFTCTSIFGP